MTIHVTIKNDDSRETAVISVTPSDYKEGKKELKGGESHQFTIYNGRQLILDEVRNG